MPAAATPPKPLLRELTSYSHSSLVDEISPGGQRITKDKSAPVAKEPMIVHGKSGRLKASGHAEAAIARLVADVLPGWKDADVEKIAVKDCSGGGGSKTFKVSAEGVQPLAVALHSRTEGVVKDGITEPRLSAASVAFTTADLAPPRLAEGNDWYVVEWGGEKVGTPFAERDATPEELGAFLGRIHTGVSTEWYAPFRKQLMEKHPALQAVEEGSFVWWYSARAHEWFIIEGVGKDAAKMGAWAKALPMPISELGARLCTGHGDFHCGNMIRSAVDGRIRAIDMEFACVQPAISDISYAMCSLALKGAAEKRAFLGAYAEAVTGTAATAEELETLAVDAELYTLTKFFGPLAPWTFLPHPHGVAKAIAPVVRRCANAREDATLREELLQHGALHYMKDVKDMRTLLQKLQGRVVGAASSLHWARQRVHVPELVGEWVPSSIDEWQGCPTPRDHRVQTYRYVVKCDGSWIDVLSSSHRGRMKPLKKGTQQGTQQYIGYGLEPGRYKALWTLGDDGVLTLAWGDNQEVVYKCVRDGDSRASAYLEEPTPELSGKWFSLERATEQPNGDEYEFVKVAGKGQPVYTILRKGNHGVGDNFAFVTKDKVQHAHGPTAVLQANGDLLWDIEGGKWLSRRRAERDSE